MGYGYYTPRIVYGMFEPDDEKILNFDLYGLDLYCTFTNKGTCVGFLYGLSCGSLEDIEKIDKSSVDKAFAALSAQYPAFEPPTVVLALGGNMDTGEREEYGEGIAESDSESDGCESG